MIKKYSFVLVLLGMFLVIELLGDYCTGDSCQRIFPLFLYKNETSMELILAENTKKIFPLLVVQNKGIIVSKRTDTFQLKKIKPVELLTMMEVENMQGSVEVINIQENLPAQIDGEVTDNIQSMPEETISMEEIPHIDFQPHTLQRIIDINELAEYETLVKNFYTIDACALVGSNLLDAEKLSDIDLRLTKKENEPQILIYHTHSQEGFIDSVAGDDSTTIMGVGEHLAEILEEQYGYVVLHHQGKYDVETRDNAYSRALPEVAQILEEYPSIEVVIDLHRDAVDGNYKLVMDLDGRPTARFMFFNGVSSTKNTGKISYLENSNQLENLAFSFQMKKAAEEYYPGLTRKNYIHGYRYNMHLLPRTTLIELGAQNNTLEEAMNACDPIAHILNIVLNGA